VASTKSAIGITSQNCCEEKDLARANQHSRRISPQDDLRQLKLARAKIDEVIARQGIAICVAHDDIIPARWYLSLTAYRVIQENTQ
jgi:hypothetical protein